jgi:hypothetical protein
MRLLKKEKSQLACVVRGDICHAEGLLVSIEEIF